MIASVSSIKLITSFNGVGDIGVNGSRDNTGDVSSNDIMWHLMMSWIFLVALELLLGILSVLLLGMFVFLCC